jgi:very-short-patch-repair endonuclease
MDVDPAAALSLRGGFATSQALRRDGVSRRVLQRSVEASRVVRLRRGVYGLGLPDGSDALRAAAVALGAVVSHDSAAVLWGLELAHQAGQHVTVPRSRGRARHDGVVVHRLDVDQVQDHEGIPVTTPLRTVLDCAASLATNLAVVVADSALRAGLVVPEELRAAAALTTGRNAAKVRRVVALTDPQSGSVLESLLRVLLVLAGLRPDESQFVIRDGRAFVARVDLVYHRARLVVEADGFEFHRERADYRSDRRKMNAFCRTDWSVLRFTWEDVRLHPQYVVDAVAYELAKTPRLRRRVTVPKSTQRAA